MIGARSATDDRPRRPTRQRPQDGGKAPGRELGQAAGKNAPKGRKTASFGVGSDQGENRLTDVERHRRPSPRNHADRLNPMVSERVVAVVGTGKIGGSRICRVYKGITAITRPIPCSEPLCKSFRVNLCFSFRAIFWRFTRVFDDFRHSADDRRKNLSTIVT